ncbi:V-type ATP synthase subunit I [Thermoproteota archaeon]
MIVPMKKVTVIVQAKDADETMQALRNLGVVHVDHQQAPQGDDITVIKDEISLLKSSLSVLSETDFRCKDKNIEDAQAHDWKFVANHIIDCRKRHNQLNDYSRRLVSGISDWESWGDFNPDDIKDLVGKNVFIRLFEVPAKEIKNLPSEVIVKQISKTRGIIRCVVMSREMIDIPFKEVALPRIGLDAMRVRLTKDRRVMDQIKREICGHSCYRKSFENIMESLESELEFKNAIKGMGISGAFTYLGGYVPFDKADLLSQAAAKEKWGLVVNDPSDEDSVPTCIRNPHWVSIIEPIFNMIEIVPGYREFDISLWFLLFLSVFFGMLIGDAAYGAIFFALTMIAQIKFGKKLGNNSVFILFYIFSSCAIAWGVLSGTFFGQAWLPQWVKPILPALRDERSVQTMCFFIGALHLSIGHLWRALVKLPSVTALAEVGWVAVLWGAFYLAKTLILGDAFPAFAKWFFIAGPVMVVFLTSVKKNIFKGIGAGFGSLVGNAVNSFTDVVSYVRLFAVGLATVAVADAFNKMAIDVGFGTVVAGAIAVFILFLGHALNIILGAMSVLVHGVRLNVLEFCNHIDVKWSGFAYRPLQENAV